MTTVGKYVLRQVGKELLEGVQTGKLGVYGSVVRNITNGKIVGYLQETASVAIPLAMMTNPATAPAGAAALAARLGYSLIKTGKDVSHIKTATGHIEASTGRIEQSTRRIEGGIDRIENKLEEMTGGLDKIQHGLQSVNELGLANLALGAAGIGVSAAGFAMLAAKIDGVKDAVDKVSEQVSGVSAKLDQINENYVNIDFVELRALAKGLDEGWRLTDMSRAEHQWHDVAQKALSLQTRFEWRCNQLLAGTPENYMLADPMLDAIAFASGLRVAALAACNEGLAAIDAAADGARSIERLSGGIGLGDLVRFELEKWDPEPGSIAWTLAQSSASESLRPVVRRIREREAATATRAAPLAALEAQGITPRDWLAAAREETEAPVLVMLADQGG